MTVTPTPPPSTPNIWPIDDELYAIDQKIADLQRTADQAQTSSAVAASEVAIAQKAIRELSTAKSEIQEKGKLWDRDAQLQRALAERRLAAERVGPLVVRGGSLGLSKTALEERLKPKLKITAVTLDELNGFVLRAEAALEAEATSLTSLKGAFATAETNLKAAESDYQAKADAAEAAWLAIQNGARILEERLQVAQAQYAEAARLEGVAVPPNTGTPAGPVLASAAEAGIAWKSFKDTFDDLQRETTKPAPAGGPDNGETALADSWRNASNLAKNALAVLLTRRQELTLARNAYEQRQALRPARKPAEQARMVASVLTALNGRP